MPVWLCMLVPKVLGVVERIERGWTSVEAGKCPTCYA